MKILVAIKRTVDYRVRVQVKPDGSGVVTDGVKFSTNPFDEIAVEEALRLREAGHANEVVVCSIGTEEVQSELRSALAMGADRAIWVDSGEIELQPLGVAHALHAVSKQETADLVILGKQAIDGDNNQVGQMLAILSGRSQATFVSNIVVENDTITATREVDAGLETLRLKMPAVITTDLRLNEPRFIKMPDIMKAKRKPIDTIAFDSLNIPTSPSLRETSFATPTARQAGQIVESVDELVQHLNQRGLI